MMKSLYLSDGLGLAESRPMSFQYLSMTGDHAPSQDQETIRKEKEKEMEEELQLQAKLVGWNTHTHTHTHTPDGTIILCSPADTHHDSASQAATIQGAKRGSKR